MYLIGVAEKSLRDWATIILAPLWLQLFIGWSDLEFRLSIHDYIAKGAGMMLAGFVMNLFTMRMMEPWMIEARFRPVANIGITMLIASTLLLATLWMPTVGLLWFCFWFGSLAWLGSL